MPENKKFCPNCGTPAAAEAAFCLSCGSKFPVSASQEPASAPVMPQPRQSDFITLSCPNCGGKLNITADTERFACQFCGHEHIVRRSGGLVALEPVLKNLNANLNLVGMGINQLGLSSEKQAAEQSLIRVRKEVEELSKKVADYSSNKVGYIGASLSMVGLGVAMLVTSAIVGWPGWVVLLCLAFIVPFAIWFIATLKTPASHLAAKKQLEEKQAELEHLYKIVTPFNQQ
jgi:hypothetical protein